MLARNPASTLKACPLCGVAMQESAGDHVRTFRCERCDLTIEEGLPASRPSGADQRSTGVVRQRRSGGMLAGGGQRQHKRA
jgi:hypothetical protein